MVFFGLSSNTIGILISGVLALFDLFNLSVLKHISLGTYRQAFIWPVVALYTLQPWIFLKGLSFTSMTVLNLSWDLLSDILVTLCGLFYFRESLTNYKMFGVFFAIISIILFGLDGTSTSASASAAVSGGR
jgi:hypothetical protein